MDRWETKKLEHMIDVEQRLINFPARDLFFHLADAVGAPAGPESSAFSLTL